MKTQQTFGRDGFQQRLRTQKIVYLAAVLGDPVASEYPYNQYVRGPYSPQLAQFYYQWDSIGPSDYTFSPGIQTALSAVLTREDSQDFLEAISSIHLLSQRPNLQDEDRLLQEFERWKPRLKDYFEEGSAFLAAHVPAAAAD